MPINPTISVWQDGVQTTNIDRSAPFEVRGEMDLYPGLNEYSWGYYNISFESTATNNGVLGSGGFWTDNDSTNWPSGPQVVPGYNFIDGNEWYSAFTPHNGVTHVFPANFFGANGTGRLRIKLRVFRQGYEPSLFDAGYAISAAITFTIPAAAPTFTSPAAGATVPTPTNVVMAFATGQNAVQVRVLNGTTVEWDSGTVAVLTTDIAKTVSASFPTNNVSRTIQIRTRANTGGLWSAWGSRTVSVSWTPPAVPTLATVVALDPLTLLGFNWAISMALTHPGPAGGQPAVTNCEVWARAAVAASVSDAFNRANSTTSLGNTDTGQTWSQQSTGTGVAGINSNTAYWATANGFSAAWVDAGISDATVQVTMTAAYAIAGVVWRLVDGVNNCFYLTKTQAFVRVGAIATAVLTFSTPFTTGDTIKVTVNGSLHTVYRNGIPVGSFTNTTHLTATRYGLMNEADAGARYEDFSVTPNVVEFLVGTHVRNGSPETIVWYGPANGTWQVRVKDIAADGTYTYSAWTTATGTIACKGVTLHDPASPLTTALYIAYNFDGVSEEREVESALLQYAGREYPVVEFGTSGSRAYNIERIAAEGVNVVTAIDKLRTLIDRRSVLCYRDYRGREMYGLVKIGEIQDRPWGEESSMSVVQAYASTAPPSDVTP